MSDALVIELLRLVVEAQKLIPRDKGMYSDESEWHARADTAVKRAELEG